jgi:predicted nucleotidyltransferase
LHACGRAEGQLVPALTTVDPLKPRLRPPHVHCPLTPHLRRRHNGRMSRSEVLATLKAHEAEIRAAGVTRLSLFGSAARDGSGPASDIDLLAAFDQNRRLSLLDVIHIQNRIAQILGVPVDLMEEGTLKPRVQAAVEREAVLAF